MTDWTQPLPGEDELTYHNRQQASIPWGEDLDYVMIEGVQCGQSDRTHHGVLVHGVWTCCRCEQPLLKNPQGWWTAKPPPRPSQG